MVRSISKTCLDKGLDFTNSGGRNAAETDALGNNQTDRTAAALFVGKRIAVQGFGGTVTGNGKTKFGQYRKDALCDLFGEMPILTAARVTMAVPMATAVPWEISK